MIYSGRKSLKLNTKKIKVVAVDIDGVLTDGKMFYFSGQPYRSFNVKDGPCFFLLRLAGIKTIVISGKGSEESKRRFDEFGVDGYFENIKDKTAVLEKFIIENDIRWDEVCYVGDDLQDIPVMKKVGLSAAPSDAVPEVKSIVAYVCKRNGGDGILREITEIILKGKGLWEKILERYLSLLPA